MALETVGTVSELAVSLETAKAHLRVTETDDDAYITSLIRAAISFSQNWMNRRFVNQTVRLTLDKFPSSRTIEFPVAPLQSISSIKYYDENNAQITLSSSLYTYDAKSTPARVYLNPTEGSWPTTYSNGINLVEIEAIVGYGASGSVPDEIKQGLLMFIAHLYENRQDVAVGGGAAIEMPKASDYLLSPYRVFF